MNLIPSHIIKLTWRNKDMEKHLSLFQPSLDRVAKSNDAVIDVAARNWQDATVCVNANGLSSL